MAKDAVHVARALVPSPPLQQPRDRPRTPPSFFYKLEKTLSASLPQVFFSFFSNVTCPEQALNRDLSMISYGRLDGLRENANGSIISKSHTRSQHVPPGVGTALFIQPGGVRILAKHSSHGDPSRESATATPGSGSLSRYDS